MAENNTINDTETLSEYMMYMVAERDTIPDIEKKLGLSWQEICELNKDVIKNPDELLPGAKIKVPKVE